MQFTRSFRMLAVAGLALAYAPVANAAFVDFNSGATDFTSNFNQNNTGGSGTPTNIPTAEMSWSATAGVADSGGLVNNTSDSTYVYKSEAFNPVTGTLTVAATWLKDGTGGSPAQLQLGLVGDVGTPGNANGNHFQGGGTFMSSRVRTTSAGTAYLQVQNNGSNGFDTSSAGMTLTAGNWYRYTATFTRLASENQWTFTGNVENLGTTGTETPVAVTNGSFSTTVSYSNLYNDTSLYGAFRAPFGNGVAELDNFLAADSAAVPEPASMAVLALAGGALLNRRHRAAR